jgi:hypothetical protein
MELVQRTYFLVHIRCLIISPFAYHAIVTAMKQCTTNAGASPTDNLHNMSVLLESRSTRLAYLVAVPASCFSTI